MSSLLDVRSLSCGYQNQVIVSSLDFSVGEGEIACLLGPSGCGKTTVLRAVAGFSPVFGGEISLEGKTISTAEFTLVPEKRGMGMVFQDYALFPHLTVGENIPLRFRKNRWQNTRNSGLLRCWIWCVCRISPNVIHTNSPVVSSNVWHWHVLWLRQPKLLLMDEPFSNLDTDLRQQLSLEVRKISSSSRVLLRLW